MAEVTKNGKKALRLIFTDFLTSYNSNNLRKKIPLSNAGSLKLLQSMQEKGILISEKLGNATFYKPNIENIYVLKLLELIFLDQSELLPYTKGWIADLRSLSDFAKGIFLFGSILTKGKNAKDVDVCFILDKAGDYKAIQKQVLTINRKNSIPIHPLYLTEQEFEKKLKMNNRLLIEMVKTCVIVSGEEIFVKVLKNVQG